MAKAIYVKWAKMHKSRKQATVRVVAYPYDPMKWPQQEGYTAKQWYRKCIRHGVAEGWIYDGRATKTEYKKYQGYAKS
jgi:hypothetical protein